MKKILFSSLLGSTIEWAEYTFYAYLAVLFAYLFFPAQSTQAALLGAFAIFGVGYVMRPLGAVVFSYIGDHWGRRAALASSMTLMGVATLSIAFLPTYAELGIWASVLLLLCRLLQGFAVAGELNGIAIFLIEHHRHKRPYLMGSLTAASAAGGAVLGGLAALWVLQFPVNGNAWRIPFMIGALGCFTGLYLRLSIPETPDFLKLVQKRRILKHPFKKLWQDYKLAVLKVIIFAGFVAIVFYLANVYVTTYLIQQGIPAQKATTITTFGQTLVIFFSLLGGWLADRYGGKRIMLIGMLMMPIAGWMNYEFARLGNVDLLFFAQSFYALSNGLSIGPLFYWITRFYPAELRYSGTTLPWGISAAVIGGTAPFLAQMSVGIGWYYFPVFYLLLMSLLGIFALSKRLAGG